MITGVHTMFYSSEPEALRAFLRDKLVAGEVEDHGYGLVTRFHAPGGFEIQLFQPRYSRNPVPR